MMCFYDGARSEAHYHSIWSLSLCFTLCAALCALGILSKVISVNATTFSFRWLCFSACFVGYALSIRWLSHSHSEGLQWVMLSAVRCLIAKVLIFSVPFAVWLCFRKMYLSYFYHRGVGGSGPRGYP